MWLMTATNPRVNPGSPAAQKRSTFAEESWWFCTLTESDVAVPRRVCAHCRLVLFALPDVIFLNESRGVWCICTLCDRESAITAFFCALFIRVLAELSGKADTDTHGTSAVVSYHWEPFIVKKFPDLLVLALVLLSSAIQHSAWENFSLELHHMFTCCIFFHHTLHCR